MSRTSSLFFAEAQHQAGLGGDLRVRFLGAAQQLERALVDGALAHLAVEPRHRLGIVVEHVGARGEHDLQGVPVAAKIGDQHFDLAGRNAPANLLDGAGEDMRAAVGLVVAVHGSDHGVAQAHARGGFGHAVGLVLIRRAGGLAGGHGAEAAGARADVAEDHEGGGAVLPALAHVGAARALANGVQPERAHDALQLLVVLPAQELHAQPVRARMRLRRRERQSRAS